MPHSFGFRARTRDKFSKAYRTRGMAGLSRHLITFRRGDYVDIKVDSSQHKGMPYHFYHGRTGVVFNVTQNAVGVEITKTVGNRQLRKRIHARVEHVRRSRCNEDFLRRVKINDALKHEAKQKGEKVSVKRQCEVAKPGKMIKSKTTKQKVFAPLSFISNTF
jgi:large subunit ribosomal protein L21e